MAPSILIRETFSAGKATDVQASQRTSAATQMEGRAPRAQAPAVGLESLVRRRGAPPSTFFCLSRCAAGRCVGSRSFHRLQLDRQIVHLWFHDLLVIALTHLDRVCVCPRFKHNVVLLRQTLLYICWQTIEIAKGRHRSNRAVGKQRLEFLLLTE